ncbi:DUF7118 family protein [Natrialbaceae archaeon AArc-T1-2]|uniref:DUF7118 family protein n=1 Tax=Natrialbaceae archaeon AArc-T1-2 TaxID=3053904 RepID=UPI00255AB895|nr:hypothetical protein [Natrialbaceae archaeon AArc-T1-2]WIV65707.1 hypothetical protein QQ977_08300 [Natrialbaceae archaeon AArc-T1-2]
MSERVSRPPTVERLEAARERLADVEARIDDHGEETVEQAAEAYRQAAKLLEDYVDRATGTGRENFKAYIELEGQFATLVENLPADLHRRGAFEDALDAIDKRRLSEHDFERAEAALEPAETFAELLAEREAAREELETARTEASSRLRELDDEITARERLLELSTVDLDAPVGRLREPIETYNAAVRETFQEFRSSASAREVFAVLERSQWYPLVEYEAPPDELREYVRENPAGEYTIPELLEYADYSRSKLSHYVDDADELKRRVATRQTFLEGIDAGPLTIAWPPEPADVLRYRIRELRPLVARIADEDVVSTLREVRELTRDSEYERLRTAAVATDRLDENEQRRLASGEVEIELEELRAEREAIEATLEDG